MEHLKNAFLAAVVLAFASGASAQHAHHEGHGMAQAAPAQQGVFSLDVYRDSGTIHVLTGEEKDAAGSLWHRSSADGGRSWSAPVRVDGGVAPRATRRGDDAQIAARGRTVLAVWSVPGSGYGGSGPFASAVSRDGGATWTAGGDPSDSGLATGHGYADLAADAGGFHAVWLDGRTKRQALYYTRSPDGVKWLPNTAIVPTTCQCCWNSILPSAASGGRLLVLYRAADPRDMELAALDGGAWRRHGPVAPFNWHVRGCPETGGALAESAGRLHALVWTGVDKAVGLYVVKAGHAGQGGDLRWESPRRMGTEAAQHGDLAADGPRLAATWDEAGAIYYASSDDAGGAWSAPRLLAAAATRSTNPRIVPGGDGFLVLWTRLEGERRTLEMMRLP